MKVHEYQGKLLLGKYGVSVPNSEVLLQVDEAEETMEKLGAETVVVKAQIHAGGRGKGALSPLIRLRRWLHVGGGGGDVYGSPVRRRADGVD